MAVGIRLKLTGVTAEQFDKLQAAIDPEANPPDGMIFHSSGPVEGGWAFSTSGSPVSTSTGSPKTASDLGWPPQALQGVHRRSTSSPCTSTSPASKRLPSRTPWRPAPPCHPSGHRLSQSDMSAPEWQLILALIAVMVTAPVVIQHSARSRL
jgi:hypothetical protein